MQTSSCFRAAALSVFFSVDSAFLCGMKPREEELLSTLLTGCFLSWYRARRRYPWKELPEEGTGGRRRRCGGEGRLFWSALSQPHLILSGLTVVCLHELGPGWDRVPESSRTADCNKPPAGCHRRLLQSDNADIKLISVLYFHPGPQWSGLARFIIKKPGLISKIKACYAPV